LRKLLLALALTLITSGCASLQYSGYAEYRVTPFVDKETSRTICCEVLVRNGKEIGNLDAEIIKFGDNYIVSLREQSVKAFEGTKQVSDLASNAIADIAVAVVKSISPVP